MILKSEKLDTVHPDLAGVMKLAAERAPYDIQILEGERTPERHEYLMKIGASKTKNTRHFKGKDGYACAVDVCPVLDTDGDGDKEPSWHWTHYDTLAPIIKKAAVELGVPVKWGGDWKTFKDGPHWELPWVEYP